MTERHRTSQAVPYAAAAWDATGRTPAGSSASSMPQAGSGTTASSGQRQQGQTETGGHQPPAATPKVDVVESDEEVVVLLDLPGFEEEQISVHADSNNLYVTADRSDEQVADANEGERVLLGERPERLERAITLPGHIDPVQATAAHDNGVCRITVPKDEDDLHHKIGFQ